MSTSTEQRGRVVAGRYRLATLLGAGASAQVFLAEDVRLARLVAVKLLHPGLAGDQGFLRRFRVEAQAAAALNHPNVLSVFDWGEEPDGPFLVLEYLEGGSLRELLDTGYRLSPAQAALVGSEAAHGLAYAHRRGFVHRDIKPANLLFDSEGRLRIADFGLARAAAEASWTEPMGAVLGTARYASPEQASGRALDDRSDVYGLALVLYEALTGRVPFAADTTLATLTARIGARLPPASDLGPLAPVLAAATIPEPFARIDAAAMAVELELLGRGLPEPEPLPLRPPGSATPSSDGDPTEIGLRGNEGARYGPSATEAVLSRPGFGPEDRTRSVREGPGGHPEDLRAAPRGGGEASPPGPRATRASDRDERRDRRRRRRRGILRLAMVLLVAFVVAGAAGGLVVWRYLSYAHVVPDLVHLSEQQAAGQAARDGLHLSVTAHRYSAVAPSGEVVAQSLAEGSHVGAGTFLAVVVSLGPAPVRIPSLAGDTEAQAFSALERAHLRHSLRQSYSLSVSRGTVIAWSPASGLVRRNTPIVVVVSLGPRPEVIPASVEGESWPTASAALSALGLDPVERETHSFSVPAAEVISTSPPAGQTELQGHAITVTVSLGPPMVKVPPVVGESLAIAKATLVADGLKVAVIGLPFAQVVLGTSIPPGTSVVVGTSITLLVGY